MKRAPVNSTNVVSIGYDEQSQMLEVEFHGSRIYRYSNVPLQIYLGLLKSTSHGKYIQKYITGKYAEVRLP